MYYTIDSDIGGGTSTLSLSVSQDAGQDELTVYPKDPTDTRQQWLPTGWFGGQTTPVGFLLVNAHSGLAAFAGAGGPNVTQIALDDITAQNVGQATWQFVDHDHTTTVIRTAGDSGRNLNVSGGSSQSGTPVIVYKWNSGEPNELWKPSPGGLS
jgi:hypothetical protein